MITHLPADLELGFPYRQLVGLLGSEVTAAFVVQKLWSHLAFQAQLHGKSGLYQPQYLPHLHRALSPAGEPKAILEALVESRFCERVGQCGWSLFCPTFCHYNAHLDRSWVPPNALWLSEWMALERRLKTMKFHMDDVPKLAWMLPDGSTVSKADMKRAVTLIRTLDVILRHRHADGTGELRYLPRHKHEITVGVLQSAIAVVRQHNDLKLGVILQRFMSVCRPRVHPLFPPTTEEALANFDVLLALADAPGGLDTWIQQVFGGKTTEINEQDERDESIRRELEVLSREIPTPPTETPVGGVRAGGDAVAGAACGENPATVPRVDDVGPSEPAPSGGEPGGVEDGLGHGEMVVRHPAGDHSTD